MKKACRKSFHCRISGCNCAIGLLCFSDSIFNPKYTLALFSFFESFFLIGGFQADAFAFMLDLVTEVVVAAFLFLIDGSDIKFDFAFLSHLTHSLW